MAALMRWRSAEPRCPGPALELDFTDPDFNAARAK